MSERGDEWFVDTEGNLSPPGQRPDTDEFGRDDPDTIERERRRLEREQRRRQGGREGGGGEGPAPAQPSDRPARSASRSGRARSLAGRLRRKPTGDRRSTPQPAPAPPSRRTTPQPAAAPATETQPQATAPPRAEAGQPPGGARGGRLRRPKVAGGGVYRRRRFAALGLVFAGILLLWFLIAFLQPPPFDPGEGEGSVPVTIPEGADAGMIASELDDAGVVSSGRLFEWRLRLSGQADEVQADTYTLASGMSYGTAIDTLTGGAPQVEGVTVPEGLPRDQIAPVVEEAGIKGDYLATTKAFKGFDPARYGANSPPSLEGFLFPATYELDSGSTARELVTQQLEAFRQNIAKVDLGFAKSKNLSAYDVLKIASMVDREVQVPKERPLVAAVIYNRLRRGEPLAIDATTRYELRNYDEQLTESELNAPSPYNTRVNAGLPPTPIGNPGLAAIKAAAQPAKVNYRFFVVKPGTCGEHTFTADEAEFNRLAAEYQAALQEQGNSPTEC